MNCKETFHIQWHIINLCNLRCLHCYSHNFSKNQNRTLEKLKKIFSNICDFLKEENKKYLKGNCYKCRIEDCSGCRARSFAISGDYLEEDSLCLSET
ncbi:MAG TPA: hypothetical protein PL110_16850 [Candidatus Eremiobacteraeota bacterium]|nr:MAG: hypothetical protein BWY64_01911 [bacterium ADurb.Bin363]HPZ09770.1 hypothetical protein [Candidatus Eremiobacteraeota bacterium]